MFDGSTYCEDDDSAALVDGVAKGFTNVFSSNITFGTLSAIVAEDEFVGVGAVFVVVVVVVGVWKKLGCLEQAETVLGAANG
ncbi:hypothetical protein Tco_0878754 [Tanacetum coccineum]|uniref:Uncharacterized protein n=1 Tax=Tanacetum coccineum TaxID=301880 RepID=A0ABQ5C0D9_9ASTR